MNLSRRSVYEKGGHDGASEFVAGIPDDWSEENVIDLILPPLKDANAQFPAWEVPARAYNWEILFRWWAGVKCRCPDLCAALLRLRTRDGRRDWRNLAQPTRRIRIPSA
jgi:hypothetical protein